MTISYEDLLNTLPKLNKLELENVKNRVNFLLSLNPSNSSSTVGSGSIKEDSDATMIVGVISRFLAELGLDYSQPSILVRSSSYPSFKKKVPALMKYIKQIGQNRNKQRALLDLGVRLLYKDLSYIGMTVGGRELMNNIQRLPIAIDRNFPGYAECGVLSMIIRNEDKSDERSKRRHSQVRGRAVTTGK